MNAKSLCYSTAEVVASVRGKGMLVASSFVEESVCRSVLLVEGDSTL